MANNTVSTTIEILGKLYPIRCTEAELPSLLQSAKFLNLRMQEVQDSGKAINLERIAIITALNIAHQFLQSDEQKSSVVGRITERLTRLQDKLDSAMNQTKQTELVYSAE